MNKLTSVEQITETREELEQILKEPSYSNFFKSSDGRYKNSWKMKQDAQHKLDMLNGLRVHPSPPQFVEWMPHPEDVANRRAEQAAASHEAIYRTKAHAEAAEATKLETQRRIEAGELKLTSYAAPANRKSKSKLFNPSLRK